MVRNTRVEEEMTSDRKLLISGFRVVAKRWRFCCNWRRGAETSDGLLGKGVVGFFSEYFAVMEIFVCSAHGIK